jgi:hypothetical protein
MHHNFRKPFSQIMHKKLINEDQMKLRNHIFSIKFAGLFLSVFIFASQISAATYTWDGGGATNNWSEAANWSENVVPASGDSVVFNATSTKNATVDVNATLGYFAIQNGYTGTITQSNGVSVTTNADFTMAGGTYVGGDGAFTMNALYLQDGNFQGGTGSIYGNPYGYGLQQSGGTFSSAGNMEVFLFSLYAGTFNAPAGTLTVVADFTIAAGATFNAGAGTVKFTGYSVYNCANSMMVNVDTTQIFNNLQFANQACNTRYIANGDTLIVAGELRLSNGSVNGGRIRPLGTIAIDASFSGNAGSTIVELSAPDKNYVINNPDSTVSMLNIEMYAANSTLTSAGAGRINFVGLTLTSGMVNQGAGVWDITNPGFAQSGGTFNGSAAQLFIGNGSGYPLLTGGAFNGGTGLINGNWKQTGGVFSTAGDMNLSAFELSGGVFNAPPGTMSVGGFTHTAGGTFNAGTGTVQTSPAPGTYGVYFDVNVSETFYNLKFNGTYNNANHGIAAGDTFIVNGTLTFSGRGVSGGSIIANGNVVYENYGAYRNGTTLIKFEDTATRTVTLCAAENCSGTITTETQPMLVNNPNITINTGLSANGAMTIPALTLQQGIFNQNDGRVAMGVYNQSGGIYNGGTFSQSFGSLNSFENFTLSGGDFNAAPSMSLTGNFTHTAAGGNFNEGTGIVYFYSTYSGTNGTIDVDGSETFYNVAFYSGNGTNIASGDRLIVSGTATLRSGALSGGTLEAKGNVDVVRSIQGGSFQGGTTNVVFSGAANQIFSNPDGFASFGGTWTINKPNSTLAVAENNFAPSAPTTLLLSGNVGRGSAGSFPLFEIVSGNVVQTGAYDHYLGSLTLASRTSFVNEYSGTITLAGDVSNEGTIRLNAEGEGCQADSILLRSNDSTQRNWNGSGIFQIIDADVRGQSGTSIINVYSGTNSGDNGANWLFDSNCLAPTAAEVSISGRVVDSGGRGIARVIVTMTDAQGNTRATTTNPFGNYRFKEVAAGQTITVAVGGKKNAFKDPVRILNVFENLTEINFTAEKR